jgi:hypothetical protein
MSKNLTRKKSEIFAGLYEVRDENHNYGLEYVDGEEIFSYDNSLVFDSKNNYQIFPVVEEKIRGAILHSVNITEPHITKMYGGKDGLLDEIEHAMNDMLKIKLREYKRKNAASEKNYNKNMENIK